MLKFDYFQWEEKAKEELSVKDLWVQRIGVIGWG
jgi:hypothetical protein